MKVLFQAEEAQDFPRIGVTLTPGVNEVSPEIGEELVGIGAVEAVPEEETI